MSRYELFHNALSVNHTEKPKEDHSELPKVTSDDNGKVLTVAAGKWDKANPTAELPAVTSDDNGKVLTVAAGKWDKANPTAELPAVTSDDNGKVLTVAEGAWTKASPSGGGGSSNKVVIPMDLIYDWGGNDMTAILRESEMTATELLNVIYDNCYPYDEDTDVAAAIFSPDNLLVRYYFNSYSNGSWAPQSMTLPVPGESSVVTDSVDYVEVKPDLICCGEGDDKVVKFLSTFHMDVDPQSLASSTGDYVLVTTTAATAMHLDTDYDESGNLTAEITSCSTQFRVTEIDSSSQSVTYVHTVIQITYPLDGGSESELG